MFKFVEFMTDDEFRRLEIRMRGWKQPPRIPFVKAMALTRKNIKAKRITKIEALKIDRTQGA